MLLFWICPNKSTTKSTFVTYMDFDVNVDGDFPLTCNAMQTVKFRASPHQAITPRNTPLRLCTHHIRVLCLAYKVVKTYKQTYPYSVIHTVNFIQRYFLNNSNLLVFYPIVCLSICWEILS